MTSQDEYHLRLRNGLRKALEDIRGFESINTFINDCIEERLFNEEKYDRDIREYNNLAEEAEKKKKQMLLYQKNIIENLSPMEKEIIDGVKQNLARNKGDINGHFHRFRYQTKNGTVSFALFRKIIKEDLV